MEREPLGTEEKEVVERQLGRPVRGEVGVAARCPFGVVEVIANPPLLPDGTPFPTLYWLTCPLLQRRVSRLESGGLRARLRLRLEEVPGFADALRQAERDYAAEREVWAGELRETERARELFSGRGGIGGTVAGGLKCLHAHLAHFLAGGDNPVGAEVAKSVLGLQERECAGDCGRFLREEGRR